MAQGPLARATAIVAVLGLGIAAEIIAPSSSPALAALDLAVGGFVGCMGVLLLSKAPAVAFLCLTVAAAWFLGTLNGASFAGASIVGGVFLLAYRGPLLHLMLRAPSGRLSGRLVHLIAAAGWIGGILPLPLAGPITTAASAAACGVTAVAARTAGVDRRRALAATAIVTGSLALVWGLATVHVGSSTTLLVANDLLVLAGASVAVSAAAGIWARQGASTLVVALGPTRRPEQPLRARLASALADPELELRYSAAADGWIDEQGQPASSPAAGGRALTRVTAPDGGEVALIHGTAVSVDPRLARAAAAAAAFALDAARLEAEVRTRAVEVRASRRRLLSVADAERRSLEQRLNDGVLARLRRVERFFGTQGDSGERLGAELRATIVELTALGRGLYPPALARVDIMRALAEIAERSPVPTVVEAEGDLGSLSEAYRATIWFICSEGLANVARHSNATNAAVVLRERDHSLELEIRDNGRGGAVLGRGLRGIVDRVDALGGSVVLSSPSGGPTTLRAQLPKAAEA